VLSVSHFHSDSGICDLSGESLFSGVYVPRACGLWARVTTSGDWPWCLRRLSQFAIDLSSSIARDNRWVCFCEHSEAWNIDRSCKSKLRAAGSFRREN
jgi:hypothetical protein